MTAFNLDPYNRSSLRELAFEEELAQHKREVRQWEKDATKRCFAKTAALASAALLSTAALGAGVATHIKQTAAQLPDTATKEERRQHHNHALNTTLLVGLPWTVLSALAILYASDRIVKKDLKKHPMPKGPRANDPELLNRFRARHFGETEK